jgi:pyruvate dehydrogenase E1 component beta subunit
MTYKEAITKFMAKLAEDENTVFLGEGIINAGRVYGTMDTIPVERCIEMPVAENLIVGVAMGLSLKGFKPVIIFQRMDFMTVAADAIINHLALLPEMSNGQVQFPVIIRAIIGDPCGKFEMGPQHCKDLSHMFEPYIEVLPFAKVKGKPLITPLIITEERGLYDTDFTA